FQTGRGLAAAHDAGLVHRDFKPTNVLVSNDGRARVLDFGLARFDVEADQHPTLEEARAPAGDLDVGLTNAGAGLGTPASMAAEQFEGRPATAASDQFSFCVAFFEALTGERPFAGRTGLEVYESIRNGRRRRPTAPVDAPSAIFAIVDRGLAVGAAGRWP